MQKIQLGALIAIVCLPLAFTTGCDNSSSSSSSGGQFTMVARGGTGGPDGGYGGDGGYLELDRYHGGDAGITLSKTGVAKVNVKKLNTTAFLGSNPLNVTTDMTVVALDDLTDTAPAAGVAYTILSDSTGTTDKSIYISDGDGDFMDETPVSGIMVASGATLTIEPNYPLINAWRSYLRIMYDIDNKGTITTEVDSNGHMSELYVYTDSYHGAAGSALDTSASIAGQNGGDIDLNCYGNFVNMGAINTSTIDVVDNDAGHAGDFDLRAEYGSYNSGMINATGGDATGADGYGGNGGDVDLETDEGPNSNIAMIDSSGGYGVAGGGSGGDIYLTICCQGTIQNTGDLTSDGGDAGDLTGANGGDAGDIYCSSYAHDIRNSGDLSAVGGDTAATDSAAEGGDGGDVYWDSYYSDDYFENEYAGPGDFYFSGNVNTSGGNGSIAVGSSASGGSAGYVWFYMYDDGYETSRNAPLAVLGYDSFDGSGGDANYPGDAGYVDVYSSYYDDAIPPGPIFNGMDFILLGGNVLAGSVNDSGGGEGGDVDLYTDYDYGFETATWDIEVVNDGDMMLSGGSGYNSTTGSNGESGYVWLYAMDNVTNTGDIMAMGGDDMADDAGTDGYGGNAYEVDMVGEYGFVNNSGDIMLTGGYGEYEGGQGGYIWFAAWDVTNTGNIKVDGGDADETLAGSYGGNGGYIDFTLDGTNTGALSSLGGVGANDGTDGVIRVFGQIISAP